MNKQEFISELQSRLSALPSDEIDGRLSFYSEMIDDRIEEGLTEEEAVADIGSVDKVVSQIIEEIPLGKMVKEKIKRRRRLRAWEITLIAVGSPLWIVLFAAAFVIILAVYAVIWSLCASAWAVFTALGASAIAGVLAGAAVMVTADTIVGIAVTGAGVFCAGVSIFAFFGCLEATKGLAWLTKRILIWIKNMFVRKESAR